MKQRQRGSISWVPLSDPIGLSGYVAPPLDYARFMRSGNALCAPEEYERVAKNIGLSCASEAFKSDIQLALHQFISYKSAAEYCPTKKEMTDFADGLRKKTDSLLNEMEKLFENKGNIGAHMLTALQNDHGLRGVPALMKSLKNLSESTSGLVQHIGALKEDKLHHHVLNFLYVLKMNFPTHTGKPATKASWNTYTNKYGGPFFRFAEDCMMLLKPEFHISNNSLASHIKTVISRS